MYEIVNATRVVQGFGKRLFDNMTKQDNRNKLVNSEENNIDVFGNVNKTQIGSKNNRYNLPFLSYFTMGKGKDSLGHYLSYYDKYDGAGIDEMLGFKPPKIYGRVYYDPKGDSILNPQPIPNNGYSKIMHSINQSMQAGNVMPQQQYSGYINTGDLLPFGLKFEFKNPIPNFNTRAYNNISYANTGQIYNQPFKTIGNLLLNNKTAYHDLSDIDDRLIALNAGQPIDTNIIRASYFRPTVGNSNGIYFDFTDPDLKVKKGMYNLYRDSYNTNRDATDDEIYPNRSSWKMRQFFENPNLVKDQVFGKYRNESFKNNFLKSIGLPGLFKDQD